MVAIAVVDARYDVDEELDFYSRQVATHPIKTLCDDGSLPTGILQAFVRAQVVDSQLWVPMLALIKGQLTSGPLREAVRLNILDEVGDAGIPHVALCRRLADSVGVSDHYSDYRAYSPASVYPVEVMLGLAGRCDEPTIAGWLLAQEVLVPVVFSVFRPAYAAIEGADLSYFLEHEIVDCEDHARWLREASEPFLADPNTTQRFMSGIHLGGRATLAVPDYLFAAAVASGCAP